jgi:hypothetical protein
MVEALNNGQGRLFTAKVQCRAHSYNVGHQSWPKQIFLVKVQCTAHSYNVGHQSWSKKSLSRKGTV